MDVRAERAQSVVTASDAVQVSFTRAPARHGRSSFRTRDQCDREQTQPAGQLVDGSGTSLRISSRRPPSSRGVRSSSRHRARRRRVNGNGGYRCSSTSCRWFALLPSHARGKSFVRGAQELRVKETGPHRSCHRRICAVRRARHSRKTAGKSTASDPLERWPDRRPRRTIGSPCSAPLRGSRPAKDGDRGAEPSL